VRQLLTAALSDPWSALDQLLDGPLHPGGTEATDDLLDRANVTAETRLLDVGCGKGNALERARAREATAIGLDQQPDDEVSDALRGDMQSIPLVTDSVDVVLAECVLCLAEDLQRSLAEISRITAPDGRIAISDVTVEGPTPELDGPIADLLCLSGDRRQTYLLDQIEAAGFTIEDVGEHRDDLLAMRDRVADRIDYERMLPMLGERGEAMLAGIHDLEDAIDDERVGYCSVIASVDG
jgi:SAM-dependent methyltransferase